MSQVVTAEKSLLSPSTDFWMVAGASLIFFIGFHFLVPQSQTTNTVSWIMYYLAFAVNYPHFMLSYQILYVDHRANILKKPSYFWAAIICPIILIAVIMWGFTEATPSIFPLLVQLMYISVGWHYIKQIFGTMVVTSAQKKFYFSPAEKWPLLFNLYSLALLAFISGQRSSSTVSYYDIKYSLLGLPDWAFYASYVLVGLSLVVFLLATLRRYIKTGEIASRWAWVSFAGIYAWYLPLMYHPHFFLLIPFFHSLQYLLFVFALKKNLWQQAAPEAAAPQALRAYYIKQCFFYFIPAVVLGFLMFWGFPSLANYYLVSSQSPNLTLWGPSIFLAVFNLFLNLHHYFIDNVIWRRDNEQLRKALL